MDIVQVRPPIPAPLFIPRSLCPGVLFHLNDLKRNAHIPAGGSQACHNRSGLRSKAKINGSMAVWGRRLPWELSAGQGCCGEQVAAVLGSHAHPAPALGSEGSFLSAAPPSLPAQWAPVPCCSHPLDNPPFSVGLHCSSRKSPWDPQSTVLPPSDASQEVPPFYSCLFGFHQSSPRERQEVWPASWGSAPYRFFSPRG